MSSAKAGKLRPDPRRLFAGFPFAITWDGNGFLGKAIDSKKFQRFTGFLEKNNDLLYRHLKEVSVKFNHVCF